MRNRILKVLYEPNKTNGIVVEKLSKMPRLRGCHFIPLDKDKEKAQIILQKTKKPTAFIWGSGEQHDQSYYFTRTGVKLKVNFDNHPDMGDIGPLYGCHMHATRNDGVEVLFPKIYDECGGSILPYLRLIDSAKSNGIHYNTGDVGITVDCDVIPSFPAQQIWTYDYGLHANEIIEVITYLGDKIGKLDIGGMLGTIPDFRLIEDVEKPKLEETRAFVERFDSIARESRPEVSQEIIDNVCSYAVMAYAKILEAFLEGHKKSILADTRSQ